MSDDSPWKPPAPGEPDAEFEPILPPASPQPAAGSTRQASPWARGDDESQGGAPTSDVPTLPAAVPTSDGLAPPAGDAPTHVTPPAGTEPATSVEVDRPSPAKRSSAKAVAIAAAVIVAVGLAGIFAVRGLTGETASGGATPDELGEELLDAIEGEDMLGVIDLLLPGERTTLGEPLIETVSELQRLEVLASDLDLAQVAGLDITLDERMVVVGSTNVADIAHVGLSADAVITVDGAEIPIGALITDNVPDDMMTELRGSRSTESESFDLELTAVEEDGRWYFSAWYSVAEAARTEAGIDAIPVEGVGAVGAESPEAALVRYVEQIETLDLRGMIQSLDPYEAAALQRYAPLFLPDAEMVLADLAGMVHVVDSSFSYDGSGSSRTAFVDSFAIEVIDDGFDFRLSYSDGCYRGQWAGEGVDDSMEFCGDDLDLTEEMAGFTVPAEMDALAQTLADAFADMEPMGAELRERDGQWYLSPISTMGEAWLGVLRALDRDELDAIIEAGPPAFEAMMDVAFGTEGGLLGQALGELPGDVTDEYQVDSSDTTADGWFDDGAGSSGGGTSATDPVSECYETVESAEATGCFEALIASGEADVWAMPIVLRFPECGLADVMWSNDIYTASDDEFVEVITAARPCFAELMTNGTIEGWQVPYEVSEFECFENRNWYATFDDPEYNDRVAACLEGE